MKGKKNLIVGLVGCGIIGQARHLPTLCKSPGVKVAAICDKNDQLAKIVANKFSIKRYYSDFIKMLENEKLDLVDITVAPKAHAPLSIQAIKAGCHVLVEKPLAENTTEADEVISVLAQKQVKLCVIHNNLFSPMVLKAKKMIDKGLIGEVIGVDIKTPWPSYNKEMADPNHWYHRLPGGLFGEILPHAVYLAMGFLGNVEPVAVHARKFTKFDFINSDELRVILDAKRGVGTITISCSWNKNKVLVDIFGTKKCIHLDVINSVVSEYGYGDMTYKSHVVENINQGLQLISGTVSSAFNVATGKYITGHEAVIKRFISSLENDTEMPVSIEDAREVVRVVEKITRQVEGGWNK